MKLRLIQWIPLLLMAMGCSSGPPISRNSDGKSILNAPKMQFDGIKKRVVLLPFFNESPVGGQDLAFTATEELRRELSRTGEFQFEKNAEYFIGGSKEIYAGAGQKLSQFARGAKNSGINYFIYGRIVDARIREKADEIGIMQEVRSYTQSQIEIRIFDVAENKEMFSDTLKAYVDDRDYRFFMGEDDEAKLQSRQELLRYGIKVAIRRGIPKIMKLATRMEWVGRVAKIMNNKIYINAGRESGIRISDILKVMTEGPEIYDPDTGALIGRGKGEVKGMIEVVEFFGKDGAIGMLHSGGTVLEGDLVQLY
jgi:hypothetical protein